MKRYHLRIRPKNESHDEYPDGHIKPMKSVKQAFWYVNNKLSDSWEPVEIYDRKENQTVKQFTE